MKFYLNSEKYYSFSEKGLELKTGNSEKGIKYIGNFVPLLLAKMEVKGYEDTSMWWLKLIIKFSNGSVSEPLELPLASLDKFKWGMKNARCILNPELPKVSSHIANLVRLQLAKEDVLTEHVTLVDELGANQIGDICVFHAGDQLIWPKNICIENRPKVLFKPVCGRRFVVNENWSQADADIQMRNIIDVSPEAGRILFSQNILCIMWSAFEKAMILPKSNVFLIGKTGTRKTTYANFVTQIYNRDCILEQAVRFNSSTAAIIELMDEVRHGVLVLDDLYPADDNEMRRHQESVLKEIVRIIGDGSKPAKIKRGKTRHNPPKCGMLFTGEYYVGKGSDAARLFPVEITVPINSKKLRECQQEPLALSTFYKFFIEWFITNFDTIVGLLKVWKNDYLEVIKNKASNSRLRENQFCLESAYKLYLMYREEQKFMSEKEVLVEYNSFYCQLQKIVFEQDMRTKERKENVMCGKVDYLSLIADMYRKGEFVVVTKRHKFDVVKHDGIVEKKHLYIRKEELLKKIQKYYRSASIREVIEFLNNKDALTCGPKTITTQLFGAGNGCRFLAIPLDALR